MAHNQSSMGAGTITDDASADINAQTRPRPMHKFLHGWRVITRHPELDRVRKQELRWSQSLDGRLS